jgi:hypothetical protein
MTIDRLHAAPDTAPDAAPDTAPDAAPATDRSFAALGAAVLFGLALACGGAALDRAPSLQSTGHGAQRGLPGGELDALLDEGCTLSLAEWREAPDAWPVGAVRLGVATYTKAQLLVLLRAPALDDAHALAQAVIGATLNALSAGGAPGDTMRDAHELLAASCAPMPCASTRDDASDRSTDDRGATARDLARALTAYSDGAAGPPRCGE